jgi:hypothetical protein
VRIDTPAGTGAKLMSPRLWSSLPAPLRRARWRGALPADAESSCVGLRTILVVAKQLRAGASKLVIATLQDQLKQVFDLAGFSALLPTCSTRREAVATVQG